MSAPDFLRWLKRPVLLNCGVPVLSVAVALIIARWLQIQYGFEPWNPFLCAIMVSAVSGGVKPGLLAMALSLLAFDYYFLVPTYPLGLEKDMPRLLVAALTALFIVLLSAAQRSAAEALRESEQRFRRLVELMPVAVYVCDTSGKIQSYNHRAVELWGREPKLGDPAQRYCGSLRLYSPDGKLVPHEESKMAEVLKTGVPARDVEVVIERPDGSRITALVNIALLRNGDGELIGAMNCFQDITERKRAEDGVRESQQLLHLVLATLPVGVAVTDRAGDIVLANAESKRIWGDVIVSGLERRARSKGFWHDSGKRIAPPDWASVRALSDGRTSLNELIDIETFDGQQKTIQNSSAPIRNAEGLIVGAVIVNEDVTERKRAEEDQARLAAIVESSDEAIIAITLEGIILSWNAAAERVSGYSAEEMLGQSAARVMPPDRLHEAERAKALIAEGEPVPPFETIRIRKDGTRIDALVSVSPIRDAAGRAIGASAIVRDISERKRAEEALKNSYAQLRALSARVQSVREEEAARIAREIHDDLGQKLTGLKMDLQRAERKLEGLESSPVVNSLLDTIVNATELTDKITVSVQEIAANLRPEMLDKLGLSAALHYEARRFHERTGVSCETLLPETEPNLSPEVSTALFRVFQECLTNIARHAQATKVEAALNLENGSVTLRVEDNGRGITEAEIANPESLGLLGMKERTALLGGELFFQRNPRGGTIVTARLPKSGAFVRGNEPV